MKLEFKPYQESHKETVDRFVAIGNDPEKARRMAAHVHSGQVYIDTTDTYQVIVREAPHGYGPEIKLWWLSIKRIDKNPIHDWRVLQAIKNALLGEECEAVELYPAESR